MFETHLMAYLKQKRKMNGRATNIKKNINNEKRRPESDRNDKIKMKLKPFSNQILIELFYLQQNIIHTQTIYSFILLNQENVVFYFTLFSHLSNNIFDFSSFHSSHICLAYNVFIKLNKFTVCYPFTKCD